MHTTWQIPHLCDILGEIKIFLTILMRALLEKNKKHKTKTFGLKCVTCSATHFMLGFQVIKYSIKNNIKYVMQRSFRIEI